MYIMGIAADAVRTQAEGPEFFPGTLGATIGTSTGYTSPTPDTGSGAGTKGGPKVFVYVSCVAGTTSGMGVMIDPFGAAVSAVAGAAHTGKRFGVAVSTIAANGYGWVQVYGYVTNLLVVTGTTPRASVSLSGTTGAVDDLVAVGSTPLVGVFLDTVVSLVGTAFLNFPSVGNIIPA